jgi:hypothetical protein
MTQAPNDQNRFWLEVECEALLAKCETQRETIIYTIPHNELYTLSGEVNPNTRWGAILWTLNHTIANLRSMGF